MPHLDAQLCIEEFWGEKNEYTGKHHPKKDGWPVFATRYLVANLHQDCRVHSFMCEATGGEAHTQQRDTEVSADQLLKLAKLLKRFVKDPNAMTEYEDLDDTMFGYKTGTERHAEDTDRRREGARVLSKKIRKAAKYIKKRQKEEGHLLEHPLVYAVYRAHW